MKTSLFIAGVLIGHLSAPAVANEPGPEKVEKIEVLKRAAFFRQQSELFNKADKNFDGQVTHDEVLRLTHDVHTPKYRAAFKAIDTNNNGFLSYDEIEARHEDFTERQIERLSKNKDTLLKKYDEDGNGTITSRELDAYFDRKSKDQRNRTPKNAMRDLKGKDVDKSGSVSFDEYLKSKSRRSIQFLSRPSSKGLPITRDANGDKIIKRFENERFVSQLFDGFDRNNDNELSPSEQSSRAFNRAKNLSTTTHYIAKD